MTNFQYPILLFHPYQFSIYQSPPIYPSMDEEFSMGTNNEQYIV